MLYEKRKFVLSKNDFGKDKKKIFPFLFFSPAKCPFFQWIDFNRQHINSQALAVNSSEPNANVFSNKLNYTYELLFN